MRNIAQALSDNVLTVRVKRNKYFSDTVFFERRYAVRGVRFSKFKCIFSSNFQSSHNITDLRFQVSLNLPEQT